MYSIGREGSQVQAWGSGNECYTGTITFAVDESTWPISISNDPFFACMYM